jgi:hypothetical protein
LVVLRAIWLVHEEIDVLAQHVGGGVAEHALGGAVERDDQALHVDDDDPIDRRIEQGLELCGDHCRVLSGLCRSMSHT